MSLMFPIFGDAGVYDGVFRGWSKNPRSNPFAEKLGGSVPEDVNEGNDV